MPYRFARPPLHRLVRFWRDDLFTRWGPVPVWRLEMHTTSWRDLWHCRRRRAIDVWRDLLILN